MAIFEESQAETPANFLEHLVGDDKKFKSVEDLAKGKWESDNYINSLKQELENIKSELASRSTVEDMLKELKPGTQTPSQPEAHQPAQSEEKLSREDLLKMIRELNEEDNKVRTVQQNVTEVAQKMIELYGNEDNAAKIVTQKAKELGVSVKFLQSIAEQSPKAFFAQLGVQANQRPSTPGPTKSDVTTNLSTGPKERTYAWYQNLRKSDPKTYQKLQLQMHEDARNEGFFDT